MSKIKQIALFFLTILPLVYLMIMLPYFLSLSLFELTQLSVAIVVLQLVIMMILIGVIIYYVIDLNKNPLIDDESKPIWLLGLIFFGAIVAPIYWKKFVR